MQCVLEGVERAKEEVDSLGGTVILCKTSTAISNRDTKSGGQHVKAVSASHGSH